MRSLFRQRSRDLRIYYPSRSSKSSEYNRQGSDTSTPPAKLYSSNPFGQDTAKTNNNPERRTQEGEVANTSGY